MEKDKLGLNYFLLLQGQCVSQIGNMIYRMGYMWWIQITTGNSLNTSIALLLSIIPNIILSPLILDYMKDKNLQKILVYSDIFSGVLNIVTSILIFLGYFNLYWLYALILMMGISSSFFKPAAFAMLPAVVNKDLLLRANSLNSSMLSIFSIVGTTLGTFIIMKFGIGMAFFVNGVSFVLSGISEMFIRYRAIERKMNSKVSFIQGLRMLKSGFADIQVKKYVLLFALTNFFLSFLIVQLPALANDVVVYGSMKNAESIAMITMGLLLGKLGFEKYSKNQYSVYFSIYIIIVGFVVLSVSSLSLLMILGQAIVGVGVFLTGVTINSSLQAILKPEDMVRTASLKNTLNDLFMSVGTILAGAIGITLSPNLSILLISALFFLTITVFFMQEKNQVKNG